MEPHVYVIEEMECGLGLSLRGLIRYGNQPGDGIIRIPEVPSSALSVMRRDVFINCRSGAEYAVLAHQWQADIPDGEALFRSEQSGQPVLIGMPGERPQLYFGFDLIHLVFSLLSRAEEDPRLPRDPWDGFLPEHSILVSEGLIHEPVYNHLLELLWYGLGWLADQRDEPLVSIWRWPGAAPYACALTHDVDNLYKWTPRQFGNRAKAALIKGQPMKILRDSRLMIGDFLAGRNPHWALNPWLDVEAEWNAASTFNFVPLIGRGHSTYYRLEQKEVREAARQIHDAGWEIGLHGSDLSYGNAERLKREKLALEDVIGSPVKGIRQHNMRLRVPDTWRDHEAVGLSYDTTLGYNTQPGFRAGSALPFFPFDADKRRRIEVLQIPLTAMEASMFWSYNMGQDESCAYLSQQMGRAERCGGLLTLLWHPHFHDATDYPGAWDVYVDALQELHRTGAWVRSAGQIADWWRERASVTIERIAPNIYQILTTTPIEKLTVRVAQPTGQEWSADVPIKKRFQENGSTWLVLDKIDRTAKIKPVA